MKVNLVGDESNKVARLKKQYEPRSAIIDNSLPYGLVSYTQPLIREVNRPAIATDVDGSTAMNINGLLSGGSSDGIHDGGDSALWTASNLTGNEFIFDSTDQARTGTQSIDGTGANNNDAMLLTRSSAVSFSNYVALTGWIYITSWSTRGSVKEVRMKFRLAGSDIGTEIDLSEYININTQNEWQAFTIPLTNFALSGTTLDELVITNIDIGGGPAPDYYLDDLELTASASGTPTEYSVGPREEETMFVKGIEFFFVFPYDPTATVAGATENFTVPFLSYNNFLHLSALTNGLNIRRIQNGDTGFSINVKNNFELLSGTNRKVDYFFSDGTNTMLKISSDFAGPVELYGYSNDKYSFTVNDNLSSLLEFQIRLKATTGIYAKD